MQAFFSHSIDREELCSIVSYLCTAQIKGAQQTGQPAFPKRVKLSSRLSMTFANDGLLESSLLQQFSIDLQIIKPYIQQIAITAPKCVERRPTRFCYL